MDDPTAPDSAYHKTAAGVAEIRNSRSALPRRLRNVLLFVDGRRSAHELRSLVAASGAPPDTLDQLRALGLIVAARPERDADAPEPRHEPDGVANSSPSPSPSPATSAGPTADDFAALYDAVNALVGKHLGMLKAYRLQMRIERCTTAAQLRALLPEIEAALAAALGAPSARTLVAALLRPGAQLD